MNALAPMNIFLRQEIDRMQRVITVVRSTLQDLKLAIDGTIIMSEVSFQICMYTYTLYNLCIIIIIIIITEPQSCTGFNI